MTPERVELVRLKHLIDSCLVSKLVKQEIMAYVGSHREAGQPQEVLVECSSNSVVQEQLVYREEQSQDQPPIQENVPQPGNLLRPSRRDGLARKIAALYEPLGTDSIRNEVEKRR